MNIGICFFHKDIFNDVGCDIYLDKDSGNRMKISPYVIDDDLASNTELCQAGSDCE
jgi:hypothetical protein